jgi:hypothetical protein
VLVAVAVGGVVLSQIQKSKNFICEGKREWMYTSKDAKYDLGNEFVDFNIPIKIFYKFSIIDFNYKIDSVIFGSIRGYQSCIWSPHRCLGI